MLQKLYPSCVGVPPASSFKLIFLAQGFTARGEFMSACSDFYEWLLATPPFNVTRFGPEWLTVLAGYPNAAAATASGGTMTVNATQLVSLVEAQTIRDGADTVPLTDMIPTGVPHAGAAGGLIVLLLPPNGTGAQLEHLPSGSNDYHCVAVTADSYWAQLIVRAVAGLLGLQDEADGPAAEPTTADESLQFGFNTDFLPTGPTGIDKLKWRVLGATGATPSHSHSSTPGSFDSYPSTPSDVEFWEGGGGFQTKVYRSSKDCLMRRRLSDTSASLRMRRIPFCLACRTALIWELGSR